MTEDEPGDEPDGTGTADPTVPENRDASESTVSTDESNRRERHDERHREFDDAGPERIPIDTDRSAIDTDQSAIDADRSATDAPPAPEASSTIIEAGTPTLENALFVVLGAIAMLLVIVRLVSLGLG